MAQQIDADKPPFVMPNEALEWGDAITDAAYFRLAWSLDEPTGPAYERFVQSVAKGADIFRRRSRTRTRYLTEPFVEQVGDEGLFADLANRSHDLQGTSKADEALNRQLLCATALANYIPTPRRKDAHYKSPLIVDPRNKPELLTDLVPRTALQTLSHYLMLTFVGPVDRNIELWGDSRTFADFRYGTTEIDTQCIFYGKSYPLERPQLVASGTLLDIITTRRTKLGLYKSLRTLAGFVLADTEDAFGIQNIARYHAPSGHLYERGTGEFFEQLGATADVAQLRERFADRVVEHRGGNGRFLNR